MMKQDLRQITILQRINKKINTQSKHKHTWRRGQVSVVNKLLHVNQIRPHRAVLAWENETMREVKNHSIQKL